MNELITHKKQIEELCKKHKVHRLYAFGSILNERFNAESDIDFLVDFENIALLDYADNYFNLLFALQQVFQRDIDLVTEKSLKNPYFIEEINKTTDLCKLKRKITHNNITKFCQSPQTLAKFFILQKRRGKKFSSLYTKKHLDCQGAFQNYYIV